jgi:hypothetical protein
MHCERCGLPIDPGEHHLTPDRCIKLLRDVLTVAVEEAQRLLKLTNNKAQESKE